MSSISGERSGELYFDGGRGSQRGSFNDHNFSGLYADIMQLLTDQFRIGFSQFLKELGVNNTIWSDLEGNRYSGKGIKITIPKSLPGGFDISFEVYEDGVYPAVESMRLYPLDVMANFELTWCKRFTLSVLSNEAQLKVFSFNGKPYRRSLRYFDPWSRKIETYSAPKWLFLFWRTDFPQIFQNQEINVADKRLEKIVTEVNALVERGQVY
ncbi:MAG: hypothetical protein H6623_08230 [Bdellovibrionaceae bacterium]|nr:hypothetical protein [Pseudobdellovibrionaceae bacterium]